MQLNYRILEKGKKLVRGWQDCPGEGESVLKLVTGITQLRVSYKPERPELEA